MSTPTPRRATRQQVAISQAIEQVDDFVSAQDLHARMREHGDTIGLATVYRGLQALAADGRVDTLRTEDGESVYRRCETKHHHHHLVCRVCGRTVEVEGPEVESWADRVSTAHEFTDVEHTVEIFGTCAECADKG